MHFRSKSLCEILSQYNKIIIYGTGNYAQQIYPQLVKGNLKDKIVCFTQTKDAEPASIDGIQVTNFEMLNYDKTECVVLIAVSELYTDEIKQILTEHNYMNFISLVDYRLDYSQTEKEISNLETFEEYCEYIADWYVETHEESSDKGTIVKELINRGKCVDEKKDSNLIVVICGHLSPRINKIIGALKRKKYNIIMLDYCPGYVNPWCLDELQKTNVQIYSCECIEEMMYRALQYHPLVYFFEPRWGNCSWAEIMFKNKKYFGKVVLTLYDVLNYGYVNAKESSYATEKYALEHADGIVWRWFSKEYLEEKGFIYQGKSLQFVDYGSRVVNNNITCDSTDSILKLCEIAGYGDLVVENRIYSEQYVDFARIGEILEKIGNRKDCVFHFYAGRLKNENIKICEQYEKEYTNFRFFLGTEYGELLSRLCEYDYTCYLHTDGEEPPDDLPMGEHYGSLYRNGIRNTFFDCVYAGLPIITTCSAKLWEYLSAYDIVVKMNLSNFDIDYLKQNKGYYKANVEVAQKELDIDNNIQKLIDFFNEL